MSDKIKVGIIGCGHIGERHTEFIAKAGNGEVVALADVKKENAESLAQKTGPNVSVYSDPIELIRKADIDAVFICVPPFAHGELEKEAAARKLPMMIEKPVTIDTPTALKIADSMPDDLIVSVAYNWRYIPFVTELQAILKEKPALVFDAIWKENLTDSRWWWEMKKSGGPIVDQASHLLDIGLYLLGPVKSVNAWKRTDREIKEGDIPDSIITNMEFKSGTLGRLHHTSMLNQLHHRIGFNIICPGLEIACERTGDYALTDKNGTKNIKGEGDHLNCNAPSYIIEDKIFLDAVKTGDTSKILCDYRGAIQALALSDAIYKSADMNGASVEVEQI